MNPAHQHLIITHVPVLGSLFGLLLLSMGFVQASADLKRASLWIFVLAGLLTVPTYLTGRPASAVLIKAMPGMSADLGDQHAEVAVISLVAASILGVAALGGLGAFRKSKCMPGWFTGLVLVLALVTSASMIWTANLGGKIRHSEIQRLQN